MGRTRHWWNRRWCIDDVICIDDGCDCKEEKLVHPRQMLLFCCLLSRDYAFPGFVIFLYAFSKHCRVESFSRISASESVPQNGNEYTIPSTIGERIGVLPHHLKSQGVPKRDQRNVH